MVYSIEKSQFAVIKQMANNLAEILSIMESHEEQIDVPLEAREISGPTGLNAAIADLNDSIGLKTDDESTVDVDAKTEPTMESVGGEEKDVA